MSSSSDASVSCAVAASSVSAKLNLVSERLQPFCPSLVDLVRFVIFSKFQTSEYLQAARMCEEEVISVRKQLEKMAGEGADQSQALDLLKTLGKLDINLQILTNTR